MSKRLRFSQIGIWLVALWVVCYLSLSSTSAEESLVGFPEGPSFRTAPAASAHNFNANIRINADLMLVPVTVTDGHARAIVGLEKKYFKLFEDKVEQVITHFASEDEPVSIGLVFDCSGSMGGKLDRSRAAAAAFLKAANPDDEFFLVLFDNRARLATGFTGQIKEIQNELPLTDSKGQTALFDGVHLALDEIKHAKHSRKAILVISDGGDNHSRYSYSEIKRELREAKAQIYSIGILEPANRRNSLEVLSGPLLLDKITQETGGQFFEANDPRELQDAAFKIGMALRNQYVLGYAPAEANPVGKYHHLEVKVERPKGFPPLRLSFPSGYFAR
jgi:VWFA-related protein